jgi:hypothetical protein
MFMARFRVVGLFMMVLYIFLNTIKGFQTDIYYFNKVILDSDMDKLNTEFGETSPFYIFLTTLR